jgi:thiol-disulfide isomerase/thioredoxin
MPQLSLSRKRGILVLGTALFVGALMCCGGSRVSAAGLRGDTEYTGQLQPDLVANKEDLDLIGFKPIKDLAKLKFATPLDEGVTVTAGRLYHPQQDKPSILAVLVEAEGDDPIMFVDLDVNGTLADNERFLLKREEEDNPFIWDLTLNLPIQGNLFHSFPIFVQYLKDVQDAADLSADERVVQQSKVAFARGTVAIKGRTVAVQYAYNAQSKKISPSLGLLGVDGNGDGVVEMEGLSPESAEAREETVIFRAGDLYLSTKRVDVEKNVIVMREHQAADYKRIELRVGSELPDFTFTDLKGKKRKLSEFRGKYLLVDFWGFWCPACRQEIPYVREAYKRFQARDFEILGMNSDEDPGMLSANLARQKMEWTQSTFNSTRELADKMRIHSWPTTLLLDPEGKIVSLNQGDQPRLRGRELFKSLDRLLPP